MSKYLDDDDILTEVLKRVTVDTLFDLKCVCKRWNKFISSNDFRTIYLLENRAQTNATSTPVGFYRNMSEYVFMHTSLRSPTNRAAFGTGHFEFIDSSNGLVLFQSENAGIFKVVNPVTKQCRVISRPYSNYNSMKGYAFNAQVQTRDFDEMLNNIVLRIIVLDNEMVDNMRKCQLYTLSQGAGWTKHNFLAQISFKHHFECGVVINGVYYWLTDKNYIISFESTCSHGPPRVIHLPARMDQIGYESFVFGVSEDGVLQIENESSVLGGSKEGLLQYTRATSCKVEVWVQNNIGDDDNKSQWEIRYNVDFLQMSNEDRGFGLSSWIDRHCSRDLVLQRFAKLISYHPSNPEIIFLLLGGRIISYSFQNSKAEFVRVIQEHELDLSRAGQKMSLWEDPSTRIVPYFPPTWFAYFLGSTKASVSQAEKARTESVRKEKGQVPLNYGEEKGRGLVPISSSNDLASIIIPDENVGPSSSKKKKKKKNKKYLDVDSDHSSGECDATWDLERKYCYKSSKVKDNHSTSFSGVKIKGK